MNKTPLIGVTMLITIGVSSAYAINITLAGDATVTGDLDVSGSVTGPTINAINAAIADTSSCPQENLQHWDKVIFNATLKGFDLNFVNPNDKTPLDEFGTFDVKILDNPNEVANLQEEVAQKLNSLGYQKNDLQEGIIGIDGFNIDLVDVEYSIACVQPGPT
ncbi:MAG: hypothetical protein OEQ12_01680 [Nitrosopumilus sp.]|nr:hypothetical protein [Nitrosopumilus sp.]